MNISKLIINFDEIILDAGKEQHGAATARTFTVFKDVIMYLIEGGKLTMSDDEKTFWHYAENYTLSGLYRVAQTYRKRNHMPLLDYPQLTYHNRENTIEEWREAHEAYRRNIS